jgi:NitT/TauT family transport system ATP-binding protein
MQPEQDGVEAAMSTDHKITLRDVYMSFKMAKGVLVETLRSFSLEVIEGETLAIVGPSGCGKTTILKIIGGLLVPTRGQVVVARLSPLQSRLKRTSSFMFQQPVLLPWLTVRENVQLPGSISGNTEALEKADSLIELVGLRGFENAYPRQLSGGMQSRASLARALSLNPEILLMDEPFGALDDMTREAMQDESLKILKTSQKTVILVTHSIDEAIYMSDRVIVLSNRPADILLDLPIQLPKARTWRSKDYPMFLKYRATIKERLLESRGYEEYLARGDRVIRDLREQV